MRTLTALVLVLCGCATPLLGRFERVASISLEGSGGASVSIDGVEFWSVGGPARRYLPLGVVASGSRDAHMVASLVRRSGGHAVLRLKDDAEVLALVNGRHIDSSREGPRLVVVVYEGQPPLEEAPVRSEISREPAPEPEGGG